MAELKVWCLNGYDDNGDWEIELFSTYEKARKAFEYYVDEFNSLYETTCKVADDVADYDCDNHYGHFWIGELEVK